jgi:hypothetical protein
MFLGEIAKESYDCYINGLFSSALFDLFIVMEHFCKESNEATDGSFYKSIEGLYLSNRINLEERDVLLELKNIRNKMFHENLASWFIDIDGVALLFSESETKKILYEKYAGKILELVLKI